MSVAVAAEVQADAEAAHVQRVDVGVGGERRRHQQVRGAVTPQRVAVDGGGGVRRVLGVGVRVQGGVLRHRVQDLGDGVRDDGLRVVHGADRRGGDGRRRAQQPVVRDERGGGRVRRRRRVRQQHQQPALVRQRQLGGGGHDQGVAQGAQHHLLANRTKYTA